VAVPHGSDATLGAWLGACEREPVLLPIATNARILVVGASGALGRPLVEALLVEGHAVRAMARSRERLQAAFGDRVEIAVGDAISPASSAPALEGCAGVHVCVAHGGDEARAVEVVARAAARAGVERMSYISGTTVCEENAWFPMVANKIRAERLLQESGVAWTIFRPTWLMEVLDNFFQHGRAVCFGRGDLRFRFLAGADLASLVVRAYATAAAENRVFRVLGPEPVRLHDALDRVRAALHPEIRAISRVPFLAARAIAALRGRAGAPMRDAVDLLRYFERVEEGDRDPDIDRLLGPCATTLDAWIARRRTAV
jgi:uncharacterized protein YbjT (DUF2867 family)